MAVTYTRLDIIDRGDVYFNKPRLASESGLRLGTAWYPSERIRANPRCGSQLGRALKLGGRAGKMDQPLNRRSCRQHSGKQGSQRPIGSTTGSAGTTKGERSEKRKWILSKVLDQPAILPMPRAPIVRYENRS
ncbi:growth factor receptor-bound protein 14 [Striga asiatica]|uniref:Growth factor receptor-bound protein 14 n=1 Tax=Striga asiatica TaxID=4170 RepID=A0A5A7PZ85_STRAF|nr:growth factor receptor-bound protein 14 [Striga asiatica]